MIKSWAWLILCLSSIGCAQSIVVPTSQCVVHAGGNPAWAKPDLDESGRKPSAPYDFSFNQPRLGMRCKADVGAIRGLTSPARQISAPCAYEAYFDERLVGRFGSLQTGDYSLDQIRTWPLPPLWADAHGLVTCLALRMERNGSATLVNAGHLPPFLHGRELRIEGALPLGAAPRISFPVLRFKVAEGDALVLMIDGVVEAQNSKGALFEFDRISDLQRNGTSGATLARAARQFGQEDDITVLTLTFVPAEVLHA